MAKKKKGLGASLRQQAIPVVQQKAPRTISTNVSTGGSGLASSVKTATQKAEEERSARMRQGLSSVVRASFNNRQLQQSNNSTNTIKRGLYQNLRNALAPVKETANYTRSQQSKFLTTDLQRKGLYTPATQLMAGKTNVGVEQGKALRAGMPSGYLTESWRTKPIFTPENWRVQQRDNLVGTPVTKENAFDLRADVNKIDRSHSQAELDARQKYGYSKDFEDYMRNRVENSGKIDRFDPSNGRMTTPLPPSMNQLAQNQATTYMAGKAIADRMRLSDLKAGALDSASAQEIEDVAKNAYGFTPDDELQAKLEAQRSTLGYGTGMAAGQMAQYALTRGALTGLGVVGKGAKATETAMQALQREVAIDQAASLPLNIIDAMKEDNLDGMIKRFGMNQAMDLAFSGLMEVPSFAKNKLFKSAQAKHIAAKEAADAGDNVTATALEQSAKRDLDSIPTEKLNKAQNEIREGQSKGGTVEKQNTPEHIANENADKPVAEVKATYDRSKRDYVIELKDADGNSVGEPIRITGKDNKNTRVKELEEQYGIQKPNKKKQQKATSEKASQEQTPKGDEPVGDTQGVAYTRDEVVRAISKDEYTPENLKELEDIVERNFNKEERDEIEERISEWVSDNNLDENAYGKKLGKQKLNELRYDGLHSELEAILDEDPNAFKKVVQEEPPVKQNTAKQKSNTIKQETNKNAVSKEKTNAIAENKKAIEKGDEEANGGRFKGAIVSKEMWKNGTPKRINGNDVSKAFDSAWKVASNKERKLLDEMLMSGEIKKDTVNFKDLLTESYQKARTDEGLEEIISRLKNGKRGKTGIPKSYNNSAEYISDFAAVRDALQARGNDIRLSEFTQEAIESVSDAGLQMRIWREIIKYSRAGKERLVKGVKKDIEESMEKYLHGNKIKDNKELLEKFLSENDPDIAAEYYDDLLNDMWNQVPAGKKEKADAWRYLSMLANPRTHARNIMGNTLFKFPRKVKDMLGVLVENHYEKVGLLPKDKRTKATLDRSEETLALRKQGKDISKSRIDVIKGEAKFDRGSGAGRRPTGHKNSKIFSAGQENKKQTGLVGIWNRSKVAKGTNKVLDTAVQKSSRALEWEDEKNIISTFEKTYARVAKARGYTADFLEKNPKIRQEIIEIATEEAQKSTYRDPSAFANWFSRHLRSKPSDSALKKLALLPFDAEAPFIKTPVNIAKRAVGYSPANVVRGFAMIRKAKNAGDARALTKAIDSFCEGLSGTGIFGAGILLADKFDIGGVVEFSVNGKLGDDNESYYKKDLGYQNYALNITLPMADDGNGKTFSVTLDWAAPMSIPFFVGVAVREEFKDDFDITDIGSFVDAVAGAFDPFMEQSFMQGPSGMLEAIRDKDNNAFIALTGHAISSYVNQYIPTAAGQTARIIDPVRRDTSSTAENQTTRAIEKSTNKVIAKIPFASKNLQPYINVKGEEEISRKDWSPKETAKSIFNTAVSPWYTKEIKETPVDKMIQDVNEHVDETTVLSSYPTKNTLKLNGVDHRMSSEDMTTFKRSMGTGQYAKLEQLRNSAEFKSMSWNEKQKAISNAIADARADAKDKTLLKMGFSEIEVYTDSLNDNQKSYAKQAQEAGIKPKEFRDLMKDPNISTDGNSNKSQSEVYDYLNSQTDLTNEQKALIWNAYNKSWKKNPYISGEAPKNATTIAEGHSKSSSKSSRSRSRSGRRSSGSSAKARAKTASEKRFSNLQKMQAPTTGKGITALSQGASGLTKAQKKALVKMLQKKLDV